MWWASVQQQPSPPVFLLLLLLLLLLFIFYASGCDAIFSTNELDAQKPISCRLVKNQRRFYSHFLLIKPRASIGNEKESEKRTDEEKKGGEGYLFWFFYLPTILSFSFSWSPFLFFSIHFFPIRLSAPICPEMRFPVGRLCLFEASPYRRLCRRHDRQRTLVFRLVL